MTPERLSRRAFITRTGCAAVLIGAVDSLARPLPVQAAVAKVGEAAPAFTSTATSGAAVSLADYRGKLVILEWTNHDCPYVRKHYDTGNMQTLQRETTGAGVIWLTVISSAPGEQGHVKPAHADELTTNRKAAPTAVLLDTSQDWGNRMPWYRCDKQFPPAVRCTRAFGRGPPRSKYARRSAHRHPARRPENGRLVTRLPESPRAQQRPA